MTAFATHTCATEGCGVAFAVEDGFDDRRRADHRNFYCPNGHSLSYKGKTELQKAQERAERLQRQVEAREADIRFEQRRLANERRAHAATKGQLTKTKKRVANGVCPCCNRHFVNVERHMTNQHPEYVGAES
ncbi:hypothetical protein [Mycolicibacterium porcinum]|uniref:hypothetical protein n=1 Tax=Mycolicibacterium porcinum TaxID=39693 RepID=UPI000DA216E0|nr:hypothetical protein [Mycolicibacterium porcinum]